MPALTKIKFSFKRQKAKESKKNNSKITSPNSAYEVQKPSPLNDGLSLGFFTQIFARGYATQKLLICANVIRNSKNIEEYVARVKKPLLRLKKTTKLRYNRENYSFFYYFSRLS
ncbi:hypothetical protein BK004_02825 [bacterium CG10_46_32]|nr:MAG: hypothetical protein BK004_02825 [bacterium CG10_46_32]PIR56077.1 MAG: hypothetical protein COU73_02855 [Parcubacteria group bacterium CG10_big_fil_rev_8_21_14_0_10_46_32]